ncbi:MAG: Uncharacterised protein [Opitutia bacterium UBA7350]|nr:MAG: Uncharacterised protein [Opitutae bacterium UBA7350]
MGRNWEQAYLDGDTPWDKGSAAPPLLAFLAEKAILGHVLVPGCGTGHDAIALAEAGADVTGMDIAPPALEIASKRSHEGVVQWLEGNFLDVKQVQAGYYDWIVEHTCLCAIEPSEREAYVQSVRHALKPGGFLWAVFFRKVTSYDGSGPPHPIESEEIDQLFVDGFRLLSRYVPEHTYSCRPVGREEVRLYRFSSANA